ncbi:MAG: class I tRNA ligase family protein, partial [Boseongicola sp.]|nr:class I tRNA ligase family protein [Boseongicola sp.]
NDLQFPHHENEIAQSRCMGHGFAKVWLHNEMLQVEGKKMSKSLGNFFTVRDLLDRGVPGEVIRFVFLSTHYRKPMDWTEKKREEAEATLRKWYRMAQDGGALPDAILTALGDDLNTHGALAVLHRAASEEDGASLKAGMQFLGLMGDTAPAWATEGRDALADLAALLENSRAAAMETKDFSEVDRLKSALADAGVEVRMSKSGVDLLPAEGFDPAKLEALK